MKQGVSLEYYVVIERTKIKKRVLKLGTDNESRIAKSKNLFKQNSLVVQEVLGNTKNTGIGNTE